MKSAITKEVILENFNYDNKNGRLLKKPGNKYGKKGETGSINWYGYRILRIKRMGRHLEHRLIFFLENGFVPKMVDHINGNQLDNRIENLRAVDNRQNQQNRKSHRNGRLLGAHKVMRKGRQIWRAAIVVNKKTTVIGIFETELEAHNAYMSKLKELTADNAIL